MDYGRFFLIFLKPFGIVQKWYKLTMFYPGLITGKSQTFYWHTLKKQKQKKNLILYKKYIQENMFTDIKIFSLKKPLFGNTIFDSTPPTMLTKAFFP